MSAGPTSQTKFRASTDQRYRARPRPRAKESGTGFFETAATLYQAGQGHDAQHPPLIRVAAFGFASWAIPFALSFLFVGADGRMLVPVPLLKSVIAVVSGGVGAVLLLEVLRHVRPTSANGLLIGSYWLFTNLGLDLFILPPMTHLAFPDYVMSIAVRYLLIPILAVCMALAGRPHA